MDDFLSTPIGSMFPAAAWSKSLDPVAAALDHANDHLSLTHRIHGAGILMLT